MLWPLISATICFLPRRAEKQHSSTQLRGGDSPIIWSADHNIHREPGVQINPSGFSRDKEW